MTTSTDYAFTVTIGAEAPPTIDAIEAALTGATGPVTVRYQVYRVYRDYRFRGDLTTAFLGGSVQLDNFREVPMTATLQLLPANLPADFDGPNEYVSIAQELLIGDEFVLFPIGQFKLQVPSESLNPNDDAIWQVNATDMCIEALEQVSEDAYVVPAASNIITVCRGIATSLGLRHDFPDADSVTARDEPWPPLTPWLTIMNDLLAAMHWHPVYNTPTGQLTSKPRVDPGIAPADVAYYTDQEPRFLLHPFNRRRDNSRFTNRLQVAIEDPARDPEVFTRQNNDVRSPIAIQVLDRVQVARINGDRIISDTLLREIADYELSVANSRAIRGDLLTVPDPRRRPHEVYYLNIEGYEPGTQWKVFGWALPLEPGGTMRHAIGRANRLTMETPA